MAEYGKMYRKNKQVTPIETVESVEEAPQEEHEQKEKTGIVSNCEAAYVREGASKDYPHKTVVNKGERLLVYGSEGDWYKVITDSGYDGYIMNELVKID